MSTGIANLNVILSQVKGLEAEKEKLQKLLQEAQGHITEAQAREAEAKARSEKLSESKRAEMQQHLQGVIKTWIQDSVEDEKVKAEFEEGMQRLVKDAKEESGVWKLVCCASNLHAKRLHEMEQLRVECENLKSKTNGEFQSDSTRKRPRDEAGSSSGTNVWDEFELGFKGTL